MTHDPYEDLADRYDWMKPDHPARPEFFRSIFSRNGVKSVLDCACGTGRDLLIFESMGLEVFGADQSDAMLAVARRNMGAVPIPLRRVDYRELPAAYDRKFDAVVCLGNAINEPLEDAETLRALRSMRAVLRPGGILVFDQGQTDASMRNPPEFAPVVNERDFTRLFTMRYAGDIQTVHIFDFVHTQDVREFRHSAVRIRIRLVDSWGEILRAAGFVGVEFFGDWAATPYDRQASQRLIAVARK